MNGKKMVILGGGFGGVEAAIVAAKARYDVTLVSNRDYIYLYPISIWIPTSEIHPESARVSLRELSQKHDFAFEKDEVVGIDSSANTVMLKNQSLQYDSLVVALGGSKAPMPGIEKTLSICGTPENAEEIKEKLNQLIAGGRGRIAFGFGGNPKDSSAVRGGPVFELMFNVEKMLRKKNVRDKFELTFFAPMAEPGKKMGDKAYALIDGMLEKRNIRSRKGIKITGFEEGAVRFEDQSVLQSDLILFTPASLGHPVLRSAGLPVSDAGFVEVDDWCRVKGLENVYAIGDSAHIEGPDWIAKQGHVAEIMARVAIKDIVMSDKEKGLRASQGYGAQLSIVCVMDTGDGAAFVKRTRKKSSVFVLPIVGHWMKKGWGVYWKKSRLRVLPRLPGM